MLWQGDSILLLAKRKPVCCRKKTGQVASSSALSSKVQIPLLFRLKTLITEIFVGSNGGSRFLTNKKAPSFAN